MHNKSTLLVLSLTCAMPLHAEMVEMADSELSNVQGAGVGFVLENFKFDSGNANITINDIKNEQGQNVPMKASEVYVGATGSQKGANLQPVTLGRLNSPFNISMKKGESLQTKSDDDRFVQTTPSNTAVLQLALPGMVETGGSACIGGFAEAGSTCSSRPSEHFDAGVRFDAKTANSDVFNLDIADATMDGSYLRLWGDKNRSQMVGEGKVNLYAKAIDLTTCIPGTAGCTTAAEQAANTIYATNAYINLALGHGKLQPLLFDVNSQGQFVLELQSPVASATTRAQRDAMADEYYNNAPHINVVLDNLNIGGTRPNPYSAPVGGYNFGRNEISGLSFNYLKVTSHDL